jgi:hypothetical protein
VPTLHEASPRYFFLYSEVFLPLLAFMSLPNIDYAVRASRPEAAIHNVTTVLIAIVAKKALRVLLIFFVRFQFRAATGMDFGFVANCGWGKGPGSKVARFVSDLIVM